MIFISPSCDHHQSRKSGPELFIGCTICCNEGWCNLSFWTYNGADIEIQMLQASLGDGCSGGTI